MNWDPFKDLLPHLCLSGSVITSWCLTEEVAGSNNLVFYKSYGTECAEFSNNIQEKLE